MLRRSIIYHDNECEPDELDQLLENAVPGVQRVFTEIVPPASAHPVEQHQDGRLTEALRETVRRINEADEINSEVLRKEKTATVNPHDCLTETLRETVRHFGAGAKTQG